MAAMIDLVEPFRPPVPAVLAQGGCELARASADRHAAVPVRCLSCLGLTGKTRWMDLTGHTPAKRLRSIALAISLRVKDSDDESRGACSALGGGGRPCPGRSRLLDDPEGVGPSPAGLDSTPGRRCAEAHAQAILNSSPVIGRQSTAYEPDASLSLRCSAGHLV